MRREASWVHSANRNLQYTTCTSSTFGTNAICHYNGVFCHGWWSFTLTLSYTVCYEKASIAGRTSINTRGHIHSQAHIWHVSVYMYRLARDIKLQKFDPKRHQSVRTTRGGTTKEKTRISPTFARLASNYRPSLIPLMILGARATAIKAKPIKTNPQIGSVPRSSPINDWCRSAGSIERGSQRRHVDVVKTVGLAKSI